MFVPVLTALLFVGGGEASAQRQIPVAGKATEPDQNISAIAARIYISHQPSPGEQAIWGPEVYSASLDPNGVFQIILGSTQLDQRNAALATIPGGDGIPDLDQLPIGDPSTPFYVELSLFSDETLTNQVTVLTPRQQLYPVFHSYQAEIVERIDEEGVTKESFAPRSVTSSAISEGAILKDKLAKLSISDADITPTGISQLANGSISDREISPEGLSKALPESSDVFNGQIRAIHLVQGPRLVCDTANYLVTAVTSLTAGPYTCQDKYPGRLLFGAGCNLYNLLDPSPPECGNDREAFIEWNGNSVSCHIIIRDPDCKSSGIVSLNCCDPEVFKP